VTAGRLVSGNPARGFLGGRDTTLSPSPLAGKSPMESTMLKHLAEVLTACADLCRTLEDCPEGRGHLLVTYAFIGWMVIVYVLLIQRA
jgi:hypothetical protein